MRWCAPQSAPASAAVARARSELDALGPDAPATVLWWPPVTRPALVLGRTAAPAAGAEQVAAERALDVARRPSGGGPVLWDADLIAFDVLLPRSHRLHLPDVVESYRWLGELVADGLRSVGLPALRIDPDEARRIQRDRARDPLSRLCFGAVSPHEVLVGGRKVLGLCQARRPHGLLLQAGLPVALDAEVLAQIAGPPVSPGEVSERIGVVPAAAREAIASRLAAALEG